MPVAVGLERGERRPRRGGADLPLAPVVELEQLVRVAVLLVVVDQPRIRRRGEDPVERPSELGLSRVAVQHRRLALRVAHLRERPRSARGCRACSGGGSRPRTRPAGTRAGACGTSTPSRCGAFGASRSKWAARRADRAARERITRRTSPCRYSGISSRKPSSSAAACGAYHSRRYPLARAPPPGQRLDPRRRRPAAPPPAPRGRTAPS